MDKGSKIFEFFHIIHPAGFKSLCMRFLSMPFPISVVFLFQNHFFFLKYQTQPTTIATLTAITMG